MNASTFAWAPQAGPQDDLCCCPLPEVFFGGARGGGKTDGVLGKWALKERRYGRNFNAIMFRRTSVSAEDAIERSKEIYGTLGGSFREHPPRWRMPNGGRVSFAYLESINDANEYQGRNVTDAWVEEAGQYPEFSPIQRLYGVLRSAQGVPIQLILTANPGGAGQHWIRQRYQLHPFPKSSKIIRQKVEDGSEHRIAVIPSRLENNKILLSRDPGYASRLHLVGSTQLVKAWLEGDWTAIEGAFFSEWSNEKHVLTPFTIPTDWLRFRSGDWGSYAPFSIGWWAVVGDEIVLPRRESESDTRGNLLRREGGAAVHVSQNERQSGIRLPRGALVRYREWYGKVGGKLTAEQVGYGIAEREKSDPKLTYGVLDPAAFSEDGGPSIAERINNILLANKPALIGFSRADNSRVTRVSGDAQKAGPMGGWDQMRARLIGHNGMPMIYCFATCTDSIRTIPVLQHDRTRAEDLDTDAEDHAADDWRYGCMSRPWIKSPPDAGNLKRDAYRSSLEENRGDSLITI